ncbi:hypothetical protein L208DRAFT_1552942 [Tricholoma matsutake]|nr:hypothetical protein L208DRAFT_1552942 [Tricholoma matsutake 945]
MHMALPKGIPTLKHMVSKRHSRPDNVFCNSSLVNHVVKCNTIPARQPGKTDHYPIAIILELTQEKAQAKLSLNFRETEWGEFNTHLENKLAVIPIPSEIRTDEDLSREIEQLMAAIQNTIENKVPVNFPCPLSKRWWTKELRKTKKAVNRL